jgi:hypothetical protein
LSKVLDALGEFFALKKNKCKYNAVDATTVFPTMIVSSLTFLGILIVIPVSGSIPLLRSHSLSTLLNEYQSMCREQFHHGEDFNQVLSFNNRKPGQHYQPRSPILRECGYILLLSALLQNGARLPHEYWPSDH